MSDFRTENHGSIVLLQPMTEDAFRWVETHLPEDVMSWGRKYAIESRYMAPILEGIEEEGLSWT